MNKRIKKRKAKIRTPRDHRGILAMLQRYFKKHGDQLGYEGRYLWAVLSALRGPDNQSNSLKDATTAIIRHRLFGWRLVNYTCHADTEAYVKVRRRYVPGTRNDHFIRHAQKAFEVLGLDWVNVNEDKLWNPND